MQRPLQVEFMEMDTAAQVAFVEERGIFLGEMTTDQQVKKVYQLDSFYVEIIYFVGVAPVQIVHILHNRQELKDYIKDEEE